MKFYSYDDAGNEVVTEIAEGSEDFPSFEFKGEKTTTTVQKNEPMEEVKPHLTKLFDAAGNAYDQVQGKTYEGDFVAGATDRQKSGLEDLYAFLDGQQNLGNPVNDVANRLSEQILSGSYSSVPQMGADNYGVSQDVIDAFIRPISDNFLDNTSSTLKDAGVQSGAFEGSRFGIESDNLARKTNQDILDTSSRLAYEDFQNWRNLIPQMKQLELNANAQLPSLIGAGFDLNLMPLIEGQKTGELERVFNQFDIDNGLKKFDESINAPFRGLDQYQSVLNAGTPYGTQSGKTVEKTSGSGLGGLIGGALGIVGSIYGGPIGGKIGSSLGSTLGGGGG